MPAAHLGLFAKHWTPGRVKTRLAAAIGDAPAAEFHRVCVVTLTERLADLADRRTVVYSPTSAAEQFRRAISHDWELRAQSAGDLGRRLRAFFVAAFAEGARRVVVLGSDSPSLPRTYVRDAFDCLETHACVLGPAADGGYYLVGLADRALPIFEDIPWSSPQTLAATQTRLRALAARWAELPPWYDVDGLPDLLRLQTELQVRTSHDEFAALRTQVAAALGSR